MTARDDMVIFFADGADSYYEDYLSTGFGVPIKDNVQDIGAHPNGSVEVDGSVVTVFARRALDTGDATDFVIPLDTEFNLGYALGSSSKSVTKHGTAGTVAVTLKSDGTPLWGKMPSATDNNSGNTGNGGEPTNPDANQGNNDNKDNEDSKDAAFYALATTSLASFAATLAILQ